MFRTFGITREVISVEEVNHTPLPKEEAAVCYLPHTLGPVDPFFGDFLSQQEKWGAPFVAQLKGGMATFDGAHLTADGELIEELAHQFGRTIDQHRLLKLRSFAWKAKIERIEAKVVSLAGRSSDNYFHWLWDHLPRLALLGEEPDFYYVDHTEPWQRHLLREVGIDQRKLLCPRTHPVIEAKELIVPSYPDFYTPLCPWVARFFRERFPRIPYAQGGGRFYISRKDAKWRFLLNEEELIEEIGLKPVVLSELTIADQILLFQGAELIVAPHGAGLANLAFCQPGARVVEIFAERFLRQDYWRQCELLSLHYTYLKGEPTGSVSHRKGAAYDDIRAPIEQVKRALQS